MDRDDIMTEELLDEARQDAVALELERREVEAPDAHLEAMYEDRYPEPYEPSPYDGTYSEM